MRLGDLDALKEALSNNEAIRIFNLHYDGLIAEIIDNAETVEITEEQAIDKLHETGWLPRHDKEMTARPTGEWIEKVETKQLGHGWLTAHEIVCSVCGGSGENDENIPQCWKFCPACGARMTGGKEE